VEANPVGDDPSDDSAAAQRRFSLVLSGIALLFVAAAVLVVLLIVSSSNGTSKRTSLPSFSTPLEACDVYWRTVRQGGAERWTDVRARNEMAVISQRTEAVDNELASTIRELSNSDAPVFVLFFTRTAAQRCVNVHGYTGLTAAEQRSMEILTPPK
jgi:hypothetical protein